MIHGKHAVRRAPVLPASRAPAVLVAVALALLLALPGTARAQGVGLPLGTQAPPAQLEDLDGNTVQLLDYVPEGKPALLEFWATWCELCEALQPQMDRIQADHGDDINVVAVAVAVAQSVRRVRRNLEDHDPGYPHLWDGKGEAVRAYHAPTTSVVVILDADGKVVYTGSGADQDLVGEVGKVLGQ
jgi:thiol-disulfide isomerase/thioredoxin